ncbi:hypothetical protein [Actinophytocola gossypii]|uniref:Uncharacterized protein n=1 Tax=Actinophytocola gossypii TaxID=2812003 RepID=A0ABT2JB07_9PSEU|nr:hypothetical protein [Actinophytocola gossypii]MCT2584635.1 hypothetical protein [Actinophytocola gossypii]
MAANDDEIFAKVRQFLIDEGGEASLDLTGPNAVVQILDDDGRMFTVFANEDGVLDIDDDELAVASEKASLPQGLADMATCYVECRWADLFARTVRRLEEALAEPIWVIDSDGVVWPAASVDPTRVML